MKIKFLQIERIIILSIFILFSSYWLVSYLSSSEKNLLLFSLTYWLFAVIGVIFGLITARKYGYLSYLGKLNLALASGLFMQVIGQIIGVYYVLNDIDLYPSLTDFAFLASIPFYIYAAIIIAKISGAQIAMRSKKNKLIALLVYFLILIISYYFLLRHIEYGGDYSSVLLLDIGYPLGQSIYVTLVIVIFFLTKNFLGGSMRFSILVLLLGLFVQYLADYQYSFLAESDSWYPGSPNDYMYLLSYFFIAYSLYSFNAVYKKIVD